MKLRIIDDKLVYYINKKCINFDTENKESFEKYIKNLVLNIKKIYGYKISGTYNVHIFENKNFGLIIEFIKKDELNFFPDLIDLKLSIFYDSEIYLKLDDYFLIKKYKNIYYDKEYFYINVDELIKKDILILSEFSDFIYGDNLSEIKGNLKLLKY